MKLSLTATQRGYAVELVSDNGKIHWGRYFHGLSKEHADRAYERAVQCMDSLQWLKGNRPVDYRKIIREQNGLVS